MRGAAQSWESHYTERFRQVGFEAGCSAPTVFFNKDTGTRVVVHGDDFTFLGFEEDLKRMSEKMSEWYEIKMRGIVGSEDGDEKSMTILNREIRVTDEGLLYKADPKHARIIKEEMGLSDDSKGVRSPSWREASGDGDEGALTAEEKSRFRRVAARANYLAMDRPDIQFAVKKLCREMAKSYRKEYASAEALGEILSECPRVRAALQVGPR